MSIIDESMAAQPKFLRDSTGNCTTTLNPEYVVWLENDQNILLQINPTLFESLILYMVRVTSAHDLWSKLESRLTAASQSHVRELHSRLCNITKGDSSAGFYLQQIQKITDALMDASALIEDSKLISMTLYGLPPKFDSFIDAI